MTICCLVEIHPRFAGTYDQQLYGKKRLLLLSFSLFFYTEDGGKMFLRNADEFISDYTASYPRK
jgi:hypothetical protein